VPGARRKAARNCGALVLDVASLERQELIEIEEGGKGPSDQTTSRLSFQMLYGAWSARKSLAKGRENA